MKHDIHLIEEFFLVRDVGCSRVYYNYINFTKRFGRQVAEK